MKYKYDIFSDPSIDNFDSRGNLLHDNLEPAPDPNVADQMPQPGPANAQNDHEAANE